MEDLSGLVPGTFSMGSSMSAGNTVSDRPPFRAPGTPSEQTLFQDLGAVPGPYPPPVEDYAPFITSGDDPFASYGFTDADEAGDYNTVQAERLAPGQFTEGDTPRWTQN